MDLLKHYRTADGRYLGAFDEASGPADGIECPPPEDARQMWSGDGWLPLPEPVPEEISRRQFCQGLAVAGMITKPEALAFIQGSALPAAMQGIVDGMVNEEAAFEATMLLLGAGSFFRSHPLVLIFAMAQSMTESQVDDFWRLCATL